MATTNPGCHLQIENGLKATDVADVAVKHPIVLLAEAYSPGSNSVDRGNQSVALWNRGVGGGPPGPAFAPGKTSDYGICWLNSPNGWLLPNGLGLVPLPPLS